MIHKLWNEGFKKLFLATFLAMALNLAAGVVLAARQRGEIDEGKRGAYLWGALVYMIEPNIGQRPMKVRASLFLRFSMRFLAPTGSPQPPVAHCPPLFHGSGGDERQR